MVVRITYITMMLILISMIVYTEGYFLGWDHGYHSAIFDLLAEKVGEVE